MVIQGERFLSGQKCSRLCWSLTDHELVLAEESKELGTCWRKGTSNSDWKNAGICSCLAMFVHVSCYLQVVFPHPALELCPWLSSEGHSAALPCRCAQLCSSGISRGWWWSHRGSQFPCSLGSPHAAVPFACQAPRHKQQHPELGQAGLGNSDKTWGLYSAQCDANTCLGSISP